jgi:hypothetical protein
MFPKRSNDEKALVRQNEPFRNVANHFLLLLWTETRAHALESRFDVHIAHGIDKWACAAGLSSISLCKLGGGLRTQAVPPWHLVKHSTTA